MYLNILSSKAAVSKTQRSGNSISHHQQWAVLQGAIINVLITEQANAVYYSRRKWKMHLMLEIDQMKIVHRYNAL